MVALAGHVVENKFLDKLSTGPSSDLRAATAAAEDYVGALAMGPTKLVMQTGAGGPPMPVMMGANELLDQLYEETERLLREKEPALHYLAKALIERDELIGPELEAVFAEIEAAYPYLRQAFQRKIVRFQPFGHRQDEEEDEATTPPVPQEQAAADEPAASDPVGAGTAAAADGPDWWAPGSDDRGGATISPWVPSSIGRTGFGPRDDAGPGMRPDVVPPWAAPQR